VCNSGAQLDCAGVCGGRGAVDDCGVCNGGNKDRGCDGKCFSNKAADCAGTCGGKLGACRSLLSLASFALTSGGWLQSATRAACAAGATSTSVATAPASPAW
jgi:hypothetical protein